MPVLPHILSHHWVSYRSRVSTRPACISARAPAHVASPVPKTRSPTLNAASLSVQSPNSHATQPVSVALPRANRSPHGRRLEMSLRPITARLAACCSLCFCCCCRCRRLAHMHRCAGQPDVTTHSMHGRDMCQTGCHSDPLARHTTLYRSAHRTVVCADPRHRRRHG